VVWRESVRTSSVRSYDLTVHPIVQELLSVSRAKQDFQFGLQLPAEVVHLVPTRLFVLLSPSGFHGARGVSCKQCHKKTSRLERIRDEGFEHFEVLVEPSEEEVAVRDPNALVVCAKQPHTAKEEQTREFDVAHNGEAWISPHIGGRTGEWRNEVCEVRGTNLTRGAAQPCTRLLSTERARSRVRQRHSSANECHLSSCGRQLLRSI